MSNAVTQPKKPVVYDSEVTKIHDIEELLELLELEKLRRARLAKLEAERG